ncbi:MAG: DUF1007 family protein [Spirochaetales bacterium]|nr:DUF1007 family protein [Spirochaetales bacterium]
MKRLFGFLGLFLLVVGGITAHPHMFIDSKVSFVFDGNCLEGFVVDWIFDSMFTESIILDFDLNRDRVFDEQEVKEIEEGAFSNLKNFGYFTCLRYNGRPYPVEEVKNFEVYIENDRLGYRFFVPFHVEAGEKFGILRVALFDETFFCDIALIEDNPVSVRGESGVEMVIYLNENKDLSISYNNQNASGGRNNTAYSGTAYPTEVVLKFRKAQ